MSNNYYSDEDLSYIQKKFQTYKRSLYQFGAECVKLVNLDREFVPFEMNTAQQYIHYRIEKMRTKRGFVKVLVLKGRQQGSSKYFNLRLVNSVVTQENQACFVLAHESKTSGKLFEDIKAMFDSVPNIPGFKPVPDKDNEKQLNFNSLNNSIYVGTAQSGESGRGFTFSKCHGSEVAFWPNLGKILKGLLQAANGQGSEIYLESTANGMNEYYSMCMQAIKGLGEFELIFVPWWWTQEYQKDSIDYDLLPDSRDYWASYMRKDFKTYEEAIPYLNWRTAKVYEIEESGFKQEYPANPVEAFQFSGSRLLNVDAVNAARLSNFKEKEHYPIVIGVDPAESGDRTVVVVRRGNEILQYYKWQKMTTTKLAGIIGQLINTWQPVKVFVDKAYGQGAVDILDERGYRDIVESVAFASAPNDDRYTNKRAEMHGLAKEWFKTEWDKVKGTNMPIALNIPDKEDFYTEFLVIPDLELTGLSKFKMIEKKEIKKLIGGMSPDIWDSFILTFAQPVAMISNNSGNNRLKFETDSPTDNIFNRK